jgi:hypothetical protein
MKADRFREAFDRGMLVGGERLQPDMGSGDCLEQLRVRRGGIFAWRRD